MRALFDGLMAAVGGPVRLAGGIGAAMLPSRLWPRLDRWVPASSCAGAAAVVTIVVAAAIGFSGFLQHAAEVASSTTRVMLDVAARQAAGGMRGTPEITSAMPVGISALSLFTFLLLTPSGWATTYLAVSGFLRAAAVAVGDPFGDPILTGIDTGVRRLSASRRARRARARREALEGPEVPDRAVRGAAAGLPDAELVIIASRRKPDWTPGTVVILTNDQRYKVGPAVERTLPQGLRTLYPLTKQADLEVIRQAVQYVLPRVEENPGAAFVPPV